MWNRIKKNLIGTDLELSLNFLGAAQNVTGSRHMLEFYDQRVLVDCGLYQERHFRDRNWEDFPVPPSSIKAILLTHAHLDHCGWLPKLVKEGFNGKVFCTHATAEIARIVVMDSAKIQVEDAEYKKKRHKKEGRKTPTPSEEPLYTVEDAEACMNMFAPVNYEQTIQIGEGMEACFYNAGHILGASNVKVTCQRNNEKRTVLFSGDIGRWDKPILKDPTLIEEADYVVMESTYGDRIHENKDDTKQMLCDAINGAHKAGGNIIIPSFSIERAQDILYFLNELLIEEKIPQLPTFLDSPMAVRVTDVFKKHPELFDAEMRVHMTNHNSPFDFPDLTLTRSVAESKSINTIKKSAIIIAGSGMCTGGRIKHHLANNISRKENTILFVGYQAVGTLGRILLDGVKEVRIIGQKWPVLAKITRIGGFSGHADQSELIRWVSAIKKKPRHVFVVHGEEDAANHFANILRDKLGMDASVPQFMDRAELD